ncbi:MAG: hypothetical protein LBN36_05645 [Clostridiales Family XIII bacterium]|jgi:tight adherence protein B|nr:hypothetical protein [Clostridiales Family XIII bacterium]
MKLFQKEDSDRDVLTDYRYYRLNHKERMRYYLVACVAFFAVGLLFYHNVILALLLTLLSVPCRRLWENQLASKRRLELAVQFRDMLSSVSASFAVGRQMSEALKEAYSDLSLIYAQDAPVMIELHIINDRLWKGMELERDVLFDFAQRSACEEIENFIDVYFTCLSTGGDTIKAVSRASTQILDRLEIRNEIITMTTQKKYESVILTLMPPVILVFLQLASPDYLSPLYGTLSGVFIMTAALAITAAAFLWSVKITSIEL